MAAYGCGELKIQSWLLFFRWLIFWIENESKILAFSVRFFFFDCFWEVKRKSAHWIFCFSIWNWSFLIKCAHFGIIEEVLFLLFKAALVYMFLKFFLLQLGIVVIILKYYAWFFQSLPVSSIQKQKYVHFNSLF
jgi:hypothetical protein